MLKNNVGTIDRWHFPRTALAAQVLSMFESGLSNSLVFFAPRRMGKTEFLRKDIMPLAEQKKWTVFYFSFLDAGKQADEKFLQALLKFMEELTFTGKTKNTIKNLKKISAEAFGVKGELEFTHSAQYSVNDIMAYLNEQDHVLLLMDEIQTLAQNAVNEQFIAGLRTALDMYKDTIKVIFTGSSQAGLRRMFSQASAPFFHFGQNLPFPELGREFSDHLSKVYHSITTRTLDCDSLWVAFDKMGRVPQLARSLVERLALNPDLNIDIACDQLLADIYSDRTYDETWNGCTLLARLLLTEISVGIDSIFSEQSRNKLSKILGTQQVSASMLQSAVRQLERKGLIGRMPDKNGEYYIDDPNFKHWLLHKDD